MESSGFKIENGIFKGYNGPNIQVLEIPEGVTKLVSSSLTNSNLKDCEKIIFPVTLKEIEYGALSNNKNGNVDSLTELEFLGDIDVIGGSAFNYVRYDMPIGIEVLTFRGKVGIIKDYAFCRAKIKKLAIPMGIEEIGEGAFSACKHLKEVYLPGLKKVGREVFQDCGNLSIVELPMTIRTIEDQYCFKKLFEMPPNLLQTDEKLGGKGMLEHIDEYWIPSKMDWAAMYLFQSGKNFEALFAKHMKDSYAEYLRHMITLLEEKGKVKHFVKAGEFALEHSSEIPLEDIKKLHDIAIQKKAKKAVELLKPLLEASDLKSVSESETTNDPYASFRAVYHEYALDNTIKKHHGLEEAFQGIKLKTGNEAPAFLVKCAIVPYLGQFVDRPNNISNYEVERDFTEVNIVSLADEAAKLLDTESLQAALEKMYLYGPAWLLPYGRFASPAQISKLIAQMKEWNDFGRYNLSGRSNIITARGGLMLSDIREAMMNLDKTGVLEQYAKMRGMDEDALRDTVLSEFGLDENGKKVYDLGTKKVVVSLASDLTLSLFDQEANKIIKSIPKKGTAPELVASAEADFAEMKKNAKKVVKGRNDILFENFLSGQTRKATSWIESYTKNPLLRQIAQLIVWNQEEDTFILTEDGAIDCTGIKYEIKKDVPVGVAHPIEMTKEQVEAWQKYFTSNNLKQPFVQIWEPAVEPATIKEDRYAGCTIPFRFFRSQAKHGIIVEDYDFHNEINIFFDDCDADVERITWQRHEINNDDLFEVKSFGFQKYTRQVNHIVAYLDRVTVYGRILNNDSAIAEYLDNFTLAQIVEFINVAMKNQSNDCLAILMDYKEQKFAEFDPMDIFTLD